VQDWFMHSQDMPIDSLFKGFLAVPHYQREFVWTSRTVETLVSDIIEEFDTGREDGSPSRYFLGTLVTSVNPETGVLELIDGQQRVTTLYVLLIAIRDVLIEQGKPLQAIDSLLYGLHVDDLGNERQLHRVQLQYEDSQGVLASLVKDRSQVSVDLLPTSTRSAANIVEAYRTARSMLSQGLPNAQAVRKFYAYLTKSVLVIRIEAESVDRALRIFETINARGQGLDSMDLLKNLLFRHAGRHEFEKLKERWKAIVDTLFDAGERPMGFIRYYLLARYSRRKLKADEVYSWLTDASNPDRPEYRQQPVQFATELLSAARAYVKYSSGRLEDGTQVEALTNVVRFNRSARQHVMLMLAARQLPPEAQLELAAEIERLTFVFLLTRQPPNRFELLFVEWSVQLRRLKSLADLQEFVRAKIAPERQRLSAEFNQSFRQLRTDNVAKYRLKFILAKLAQRVDVLAYGPKGLDEYLGKHTEIEHILPISPDELGLAAFGGASEASAAAQHISNLTLIEKPLNAVGSNKPFKEKAKVYSQSRFLLTKGIAGEARVGRDSAVNRALEYVAQYDDWDPTSMQDRENRLVRLANAIWQPGGLESEAARAANA